jgi:para-aminobenzoate synthetase component 1
MQMLNWANQFNICALLDNHQYQQSYHSVECLLAVDVVSSCTVPHATHEQLNAYIENTPDWLFGHVGYGFNHPLLGIESTKQSPLDFADAYFFQPQTIVEIKGEQVTIACLDADPALVYQQIHDMELPAISHKQAVISMQPKIAKEQYLHIITKLKQHILRGDCYEINFCQEFFAEHVSMDVIETYHKLVNISPNPFAGFYKVNQDYLLCASPERYIKKTGNHIISQPIKGTIKRNLNSLTEDHELKQTLQQSPKDRSENVMVVDLVRNDLSKVCKQGTVQVEELFGIYSFPQVHQMISTISGELMNHVGLIEVLTASFPMGSMTGAPKKRVMELTEQYEQSKRGIYSGCVGYITPQKDYDFNVVIRSLMYNKTQQYLSYQVGGGITFNSEPEAEYEECMVKAAAIQQVLQ